MKKKEEKSAETQFLDLISIKRNLPIMVMMVSSFVSLLFVFMVGMRINHEQFDTFTNSWLISISANLLVFGWIYFFADYRLKIYMKDINTQLNELKRKLKNKDYIDMIDDDK
jgi:high-affinity Fe2+/Pb2+ permease